MFQLYHRQSEIFELIMEKPLFCKEEKIPED
jgi:hypothetical protein